MYIHTHTHTHIYIYIYTATGNRLISALRQIYTQVTPATECEYEYATAIECENEWLYQM